MLLNIDYMIMVVPFLLDLYFVQIALILLCLFYFIHSIIKVILKYVLINRFQLLYKKLKIKLCG